MMTPATGFQKLRFHADDGSEFPEWNKKKLSEVFSKITRKNVDRKIELVLTNSAEHGIIPQREFFDKDIASVENIDGYYILNPNDFVYNPRKSKAAPYGPFQCYYGEIPGVVSPLYTCLHPITKDCSQYLMRYFASAAWHRFVYDNGSVGARHDRVSMTDDILFNIPVEIPCLEEQQKIADFLSAYDKKISLQRERVETLKEQKKGLLQKMFPKEGESVPELRFPGFTGDWEQRKLSDLCSLFTDGDWIESKDQSTEGVRLVQTGNVGVTQYLDKTNHAKWISEDTFNRLKCEEIFEGDILISRLPDPAGRACIMPNLGTKMITAVDCTIVRTLPDVSSEYLVQYLSTERYFKEINNCLAGGTRQRVSRGNLAEFEIPLPNSADEQKAIGNYFKSLDHLITLHQRKLETMQEIKKGLLQQMFV